MVKNIEIFDFCPYHPALNLPHETCSSCFNILNAALFTSTFTSLQSSSLPLLARCSIFWHVASTMNINGLVGKQLHSAGRGLKLHEEPLIRALCVCCRSVIRCTYQLSCYNTVTGKLLLEMGIIHEIVTLCCIVYLSV